MTLAALPKTPASTLPRLPEGSMLPNAHFIGLSVGRMAASKTTSAVRMLKSYPQGYWTRFFVVSSTPHSQRHLFIDYLGCAEEDIYEAVSARDLMNAMRDIQEKVTGQYKQWLDDKDYAVAYRKLSQGKELTSAEESLLLTRDAAPPISTTRRPVCAVLIDDQQALGGLTSKSFLSACVRHRHLCAIPGRGAAGLSLMIMAQTLKSSASRPLRLVTSFFMLFACQDKKQAEELADEVAGHVDKQTFIRAFQEATSEPYGFLTVNLQQRDTSRLMTRSLQEYIVL
jgi:hypothetical protein